MRLLFLPLVTSSTCQAVQGPSGRSYNGMPLPLNDELSNCEDIAWLSEQKGVS